MSCREDSGTGITAEGGGATRPREGAGHGGRARARAATALPRGQWHTEEEDMNATGCLLPLLSLLLLAQTPPEPRFPFVERFDATAAQRWTVLAGKWEFLEGRARQSDPMFDAGAALAVRPEGPYWLAVRFRPESDFNGGGLFFALPQVDAKKGGMLVRCDPGGRILWGWFDGTGTFNYYADANYDDDGDREQELAVAVDPAKNAFNLYHHGERIATNLRTFHTQGFVGIQTSGGPHTILGFEVRPARPEELEGLRPPSPYSSIIDLAGTSEHVIALRRADEVLTGYDASGLPVLHCTLADFPGGPKTLEEFGPVALCCEPAGRNQPANLLLLAGEGRTIWRLGPDLKPRGGGPLIHEPRMAGTALAVGRTGLIFVADAARPGIRAYHLKGEPAAEFGVKGDVAAYDRSDPKTAGKFKAPRGIAVSPDGLIYVADRENYTFVVYRWDGREFEFVRNGPWLPYPGQILFDGRGRMLMAGTFEYYRGYGAVRVFDREGAVEKTWLAHTLKDMSDKVRVCQGPGGQYYVADPDKDRILILPPDFVEPLPQFAWTADGGVQLTTTRVDGSPLVATSTEPDPKSPGRILVRQREPVCATWPPVSADDLRTYSLPAPPPKGKMHVIDLPVLVAVFTQATTEKGERITIDPTGVIDRLKRELAVARHFYWLSSHGRLNLQFDYMLVDDPEAKIDGGWIQPSPARQMVNKARAAQGLPAIDEHHSLIGIHPMKGFDAGATDDPGYVGGGGLTPYAYSGYGLWNNGQGWLFGHEWGHQLDAYFEKSGFTDWWLNHPDATVHIGRYGEHWDCNAFLCRRVDPLNWLRLRQGTLRLVDDRDGDGLADADPALPIDERRFGSDPARGDTDGDGLDDLAELCAGTFTSSDPTKLDTDADGTPDAADPFPQFAVRLTLSRRPAGAPLGTIRNGWCDADLDATYDADHLYVRLVLRKPVRSVQLPLDWYNDGWFTGHDNRYYSVDLEWPADGPPKVGTAHGCTATIDRPEGQPAILEVTIPRLPEREPLESGTTIGLIPRLTNGGGTSAFLVDPWQIVPLRLE